MEGWRSGLTRTLGERVSPKGEHGFESHSFRQYLISSNFYIMSTLPGFEAYYDMWVRRMSLEEHNLVSRAMHYGYNPDPNVKLSSEAAKLTTNVLIAEQLDLPVDEPVKIADLGCGVGGTALHLNQLFPKSSIYTVNIHTPQLTLLRTFPNFPVKQIFTLNGDFSKLPIALNSLDGAYAIDSSCYAMDKAEFYTEVMSRLIPGRKFVIFDVFNKRPPENQLEELLLKYSLTGWMVPSWHNPNGDNIFNTYTFFDITNNVMPDLIRSYNGAKDKITQNPDSIMIGHLQAIIALYHCIDLGLLQYGLLVATKF